MFCNYCGSRNPDAARYCNQCGRETRRSAIAPPQPASKMPASISNPSLAPAPRVPAVKAAKLCPACGLTSPHTSAICKCGFDFGYGGHRPSGASEAPAIGSWARLYGWLSIVAGSYLVIASVAILVAGPQTIPGFLPLGNATQLGVAGSILQAAFFVAAGVAILHASKIAPRIVWASVVVSAFAIVVRGLNPLEAVLWAASLGLGIWYSSKRKPTPREPTTVRGTLGFLRNARVVAAGAGCIAVVIVLTDNLQRRSPEHARVELASLNIPYNDRSFLKASVEGDGRLVKLFLQAGMDPNIALHAAAHGAHPELVHLLMDRGASVNNKDETGETPLMEAVMAEDTKEAKFLIELGADPNAPGSDAEPCSTPLMLAASTGNADLVALLLSSGANPNAGRNQQTPLSCALQGSKKHNAEVVKALLEKGAVPSDRAMAPVRVKAVEPPRRATPPAPASAAPSPKIKVLPSVRLPLNVSPPQPATVQPAGLPKEVAIIRDLPPAPSSALGEARERNTGDAEGLLGGTITSSPPLPPSLERIRVGGSVQAAKLISRTQPDYPVLARQAQISGAVRLEAVISKTGAIKNLVVISGHPMLAQAALDAVKNWRYMPTLLNGVPVEVITTVDINFIAPGRTQ